MCFAFLSETLTFFSNDADCEEAVAALLKTPHPPATLVTCILGRYDSYKHWTKLPGLVAILQHAIALGEGRQTGETLKMQNVIRRLFADKAWLESIFGQLSADEKVQIFERFQASTAWDPATHRTITIRMTKIDPNLASHVVRKAEKKVEARVTSQRSFNEKKAAYDHLVNVEMPENTKRIEFARGYGDLSENAEYQYAKDEQRALLQKQTVMQEEPRGDEPTVLRVRGASHVTGAIVTGHRCRSRTRSVPIGQINVVVVNINGGPAGPAGVAILEAVIEGQAAHLAVGAFRLLNEQISNPVAVGR